MTNPSLSLDTVMEDWGGMTSALSPDGKGIFSMAAWMAPSTPTGSDTEQNHCEKGVDTIIEFSTEYDSEPTPAMEVVFDYSSDGCHELIYEDVPSREISPTSVMDAFFPMDEKKSSEDHVAPSVAATDSSSSSNEYGAFHKEASQQSSIVKVPTDDIALSHSPHGACSNVNAQTSFLCMMPITQGVCGKDEVCLSINCKEGPQNSKSRPFLEQSFCYGPCGGHIADVQEGTYFTVNQDAIFKGKDDANSVHSSDSSHRFSTRVPKFITMTSPEPKDSDATFQKASKAKQQVFRYLVKMRPYYEPNEMTEYILIQMKKSRVFKNAALDEMMSCFDEALQFDLSGSLSFIGRSHQLERARKNKAACVAELAECFRKVNELRDQGMITVKLTFSPSQSEETESIYKDCASCQEDIGDSAGDSNDESDGTSFFDANDEHHSDEGMAWQVHASLMHSVKVELLRNEVFETKRLKTKYLSELHHLFHTALGEQTLVLCESKNEDESDDAFMNELFSFIDQVYFPESLQKKNPKEQSQKPLADERQKETTQICCRETSRMLLSGLSHQRSVEKQNVLVLQRNARRFLSQNRCQNMLKAVITIQRSWRLHRQEKINKRFLQEKIERERSLAEARRSQYQLAIKRASLREAVCRQNLKQMKDRCMEDLEATVQRNSMITEDTQRLKKICLSQMLHHKIQEDTTRARKDACMEELKHFIAEASHNEEYWIQGQSISFSDKEDTLPNIELTTGKEEEEIIFYDARSDETPQVSYANELLGIDILQWFDQVHGEIMASLAKDTTIESKEEHQDERSEIDEIASSTSSFDFLTKNRLSTIDEGEDESVKTEATEILRKPSVAGGQAMISGKADQEEWISTLALLHKSLDIVDMSCFNRKVENHTFKFKE